MSASYSGQTRIWDLNGEDLATPDDFEPPMFQPPSPYYSPSILSSHRQLAGICLDTAVCLWNRDTGKTLGVLTGLRGGRIIQIGPEGHYMASADVSDEIVYAVELESGERLTLRQEEFERRFGWKNDPEQAKIQLD